MEAQMPFLRCIRTQNSVVMNVISQMPKDVEYFITGLRSKSDDAKLKAAREFKNYVVNELKDKTREEMTNFIDKLLKEFIQLVTGNCIKRWHSTRLRYSISILHA